MFVCFGPSNRFKTFEACFGHVLPWTYFGPSNLVRPSAFSIEDGLLDSLLVSQRAGFSSSNSRALRRDGRGRLPFDWRNRRMSRRRTGRGGSFFIDPPCPPTFFVRFLVHSWILFVCVSFVSLFEDRFKFPRSFSKFRSVATTSCSPILIVVRCRVRQVLPLGLGSLGRKMEASLGRERATEDGSHRLGWRPGLRVPSWVATCHGSRDG